MEHPETITDAMEVDAEEGRSSWSIGIDHPGRPTKKSSCKLPTGRKSRRGRCDYLLSTGGDGNCWHMCRRRTHAARRALRHGPLLKRRQRVEPEGADAIQKERTKIKTRGFPDGGVTKAISA